MEDTVTICGDGLSHRELSALNETDIAKYLREREELDATLKEKRDEWARIHKDSLPISTSDVDAYIRKREAIDAELKSEQEKDLVEVLRGAMANAAVPSEPFDYNKYGMDAIKKIIADGALTDGERIEKIIGVYSCIEEASMTG
jgi:hypothetical protein